MRDELLALFPALRQLPANAYVVGGAVRDLLLGAHPADVDVACLDPLACARTLRRKVIRLGREEHISAYRVIDGKHAYDFAALLDGALDADLGRRDFTINAMAVDLASGALLDPHGGRRDLDARLVRMVDAANFDDDPLRMLKAIRMAVRLDVALFGRALDATRYHADDVPLAAALAILVDDPPAFAERWKWSDALRRDVVAPQRLASERTLVSPYDAGADGGAVARRGNDARRGRGLRHGVNVTCTSPAVVCRFTDVCPPAGFVHFAARGKTPSLSMRRSPTDACTSPTRPEALRSFTVSRGSVAWISPARRSHSTEPKLPSRSTSPYFVSIETSTPGGTSIVTL